MHYCFVIPHFNHLAQFSRFLPALLATGLDCVVVDDGSHQSERQSLQTLLASHPRMHLYCHSHNRGKGAAVLTACCHARALGFTHAIQIDADGQHRPQDVSRFIEASQRQPEAIISGMPRFDESAPAARRHGRKVSTFWTCLETLSLDIKDALCGYRVYPLQTVEHLLDHYHIGAGMDFDTDMLVKAKWSGFALHFIDTEVTYIDAGISHFRYLGDNLRLIGLHLRLLPQAPFRLALRTALQLRQSLSTAQ